jgi:hypothetical protein
VVLTKDHLARRNWDSGKQCSFCMHDESIQYLFFEWYARFLWGLVQITFGISQPQNVQHIFGIWINQVGGRMK